MNVLFYGTGLIFVAFSIHLIVWRFRLPQGQTKTLLQIFFGTLIIGILLLWQSAPHITILSLPAPASGYEYLHLSFFYVSLTLAYIATYSALEADSPSLIMVMNIAKAGSKGLAKNTLEQKMGDDVLILPKLRELVAGGMLFLDGETYKLKPKAIFIARMFIAYRGFLKRAPKGG